MQVLRGDNAAFAFELYRQLRATGGNFMFSPHGISLALALSYAGARGETARQMASALHYSLPDSRLHAAFNTLAQDLAARSSGAQGADSQGFRLNVVNAFWGQTGYQFLSGFLDTLALNYGAGLRLLDFAGAPDDARQTINRWVSDQTEKRIPELLDQGVIQPSTIIVLTNAIYFNAAWQFQFDPRYTADGAFALLDGKTVSVPMMQHRDGYPYAEGDGWQALELPYDGRDLAMDVLLPASGRFDDFESSLSSERLDAILNGMAVRLTDVSLPRFKYESSFELAAPLHYLGMADAFQYGRADFSGMDGARDLFISAIVHKTFIAVDEKGTEAAAATAVLGRGGGPVQTIAFKVDRPFVFVIRDLKTGALLFVGRVVNPAP